MSRSVEEDFAAIRETKRTEEEEEEKFQVYTVPALLEPLLTSGILQYSVPWQEPFEGERFLQMSRDFRSVAERIPSNCLSFTSQPSFHRPSSHNFMVFCPSSYTLQATLKKSLLLFKCVYPAHIIE